ncbi:uncharacterized protein Fot_24064 [Forsythia ovata]|uniref:Small ribosomal subunit protein mS23 n=1 Tax=Forsythia ovata TaxID=205694 RepID=A0ABD1U546_9LAMI
MSLYERGFTSQKPKNSVKGLAKSEPIWLKAMEKVPPATFPHAENKIKLISLSEDVYISKFFQKHPDSKHEDPINKIAKLKGKKPPPNPYPSAIKEIQAEERNWSATDSMIPGYSKLFRN